MSNGKKSGWEKAEILLKPVGGLLAALTVTIIGFLSSNYLGDRQNIETRLRLYTELISKREEAESALRKDMFTSIIGSFLEPKTEALEPKILQLELLAHNFHESLNLRPLFMHLKRRIEREDIKDPGIKKDYIKRLRRVAREVMWKQLGILEGAGVLKQIDIDLSIRCRSV